MAFQINTILKPESKKIKILLRFFLTHFLGNRQMKNHTPSQLNTLLTFIVLYSNFH